MSGANQPEAEAPMLVVVTGVPGTGKSSVAEVVAGLSQASVLGHDWTMSALRTYPGLQRELDDMEPPGHRTVGWAIMTALAREQLRNGRSVVLDGVARAPEVAMCREAARSESGRMVVIATRCSNRALHRSRIEGRQRAIPDWYELDWEHVEQTLAHWEPPDGADLCLDASDPWTGNVSRVRELLRSP
ncbi:MAG: AAA family ATPase [Acidimicrobiales bacterium]|jgi:predicted kinase